MKLSECRPRFWTAGPDGRHGLGISFDCPLCVREGRPSIRGQGPFPKDGAKYAATLPCRFANPIDGGAPLPPDKDPTTGKEIPCAFWQRTGETIETISLHPSINAEGQDHGTHKGWHGHVKNGEIIGGGI
jgi:hypothetical protein